MCFDRPYSLLILFLVSVLSAQAQWGVGLYGAYQQSKFSGVLPSDLEYVYTPGWAVGITFDRLIAEDVYLSLRPTFSESGTDVELENGPSTYQSGEYDSIYLNDIISRSIALPIICQIYVRKNFYCNSGLELAYRLSTDVDLLSGYLDVDEKFNPLNLSAIFGIGIPVPVGKTSFNLEFAYSQGINTLTPKNDIEAGTAPRVRANRFRISIYFILFNAHER